MPSKMPFNLQLSEFQTTLTFSGNTEELITPWLEIGQDADGLTLISRDIQNPLFQPFRDLPAEGGAIRHLQTLLGQYGYLHSPCCPGVYDEATRQAVARYQSFYRIDPDEDGVCDEETLALLNQPRCGLPDPQIGIISPGHRLAPFVASGAKWPAGPLTYRFLNGTPDLDQQRQRGIIREAFRRWSDVAGLEFREVAPDLPTTLSVAFHQGNHGDGYPFDDQGGPAGNTLAHAFYPPPLGGAWAGSLHFDEFELWKDAPGGPGFRLYNIALHEIGHLLGLDHSQDGGAIMYAYYGELRDDLNADDIAGAQSLYGAPVHEAELIQLGQVISGALEDHGEKRYQLTVQDKLLVRLSGPPGQDFDLYIRRGAPAGRGVGEYDGLGYGSTADETVSLENVQPGTYHLLVHSYRGSGWYQLEVELV